MLGSVMKMSYGLLSLEPKDKDGNPIENLEDHAVCHFIQDHSMRVVCKIQATAV